jgi:hypothetical protein
VWRGILNTTLKTIQPDAWINEYRGRSTSSDSDTERQEVSARRYEHQHAVTRSEPEVSEPTLVLIHKLGELSIGCV